VPFEVSWAFCLTEEENLAGGWLETAPGVHRAGQVEVGLLGRDVRNIGDPEAVRALQREVSIRPIRRSTPGIATLSRYGTTAPSGAHPTGAEKF